MPYLYKRTARQANPDVEVKMKPTRVTDLNAGVKMKPIEQKMKPTGVSHPDVEVKMKEAGVKTKPIEQNLFDGFCFDSNNDCQTKRLGFPLMNDKQ